MSEKPALEQAAEAFVFYLAELARQEVESRQALETQLREVNERLQRMTELWSHVEGDGLLVRTDDNKPLRIGLDD